MRKSAIKNMNRHGRLISYLFLSFALMTNANNYACAQQYILSDTIPYEERLSEYQKDNLIANCSFESVEIDKSKYNMPGWHLTGNRVSVINNRQSDSLDANTAKLLGEHSVYIHVSDSDISEVNTEENGIESDYIKVLPLNYDFSFYIKLKNIIPSSEIDRFQQRIGKDIDIRFEYFDSDKNVISPAIYCEYIKKDVDVRFKGFAFSNFFYIKNFDWAKVLGRTWEYPFSNGDMPNHCAYIKIFVGLKCPGELWIDNLVLKLSKWNFTPQERLLPFAGRSYTRRDLLIPAPRYLNNNYDIALSAKNRLFILNASAYRPQADFIYKKLFLNNPGIIWMSSNAKVSVSQNDCLIKLIDSTSILSKDIYGQIKTQWDSIKYHPQGYFIKRINGVIYVGANDLAGIYYACSTLTQLIDTGQKKIFLADIIDYPDFLGRTAKLMSYQTDWYLQRDTAIKNESEKLAVKKEQVENLGRQVKEIDFYAKYKINVFYNDYHQLTDRWWIPDSFFIKLYQSVNKRCNEYNGILETAVQINPYMHLGKHELSENSLSDSIREIFNHYDGAAMILSAIRPALQSGIKRVMLCADDYVPHIGGIRGYYSIFNNVDREHFINLSEAQAYLINNLKDSLKSEYGVTRLEFVPPQYNNRFINYGRGSAEVYFTDLSRRIDSTVPLIWTGHTVRSLSYDMADILQCREVYHTNKPLIWDNTPYARSVEIPNGGYPVNYPQKAIYCNLFEPFDILYPDNFKTLVNDTYFSNNDGFSEISKIKNLTYADFVWNSTAYNADLSLFKVLYSLYGLKNAQLLMAFNEVYYKLVSVWGTIRMQREENKNYVITDDEKNKITELLENVDRSFNQLNGAISCKKLLNELDSIRISKEKQIKSLIDM